MIILAVVYLVVCMMVAALILVNENGTTRSFRLEMLGHVWITTQVWLCWICWTVALMVFGVIAAPYRLMKGKWPLAVPDNEPSDLTFPEEWVK